MRFDKLVATAMLGCGAASASDVHKHQRADRRALVVVTEHDIATVYDDGEEKPTPGKWTTLNGGSAWPTAGFEPSKPEATPVSALLLQIGPEGQPRYLAAGAFGGDLPQSLSGNVGVHEPSPSPPAQVASDLLFADNVVAQGAFGGPVVSAKGSSPAGNAAGDRAAPISSPVSGDNSSSKDKPAAADNSSSNDKPAATDNSSSKDRPAAADNSSSEDKPASGDSSSSEDKPAAADNSSSKDKPAAGDNSSLEDKPAAADNSSSKDKPAAGDNSSSKDGQAPASGSAPAGASKPASNSSPSNSASPIPGSGDYSHHGGGALGITYTPYAADGTCKSPSQIRSDLSELGDFHVVRLYGVDCAQVENALQGKVPGQKLFIGVFFMDQIEQSVRTIKNAVEKYGSWDDVETVSIGNELVNSGAATVSQIADYMKTARRALSDAGYNGPVVSVDTFIAVINNPGLCELSDYMAVNAHAYFDEYTPAEKAGSWVLQQIQRVWEACDGKKRVIVTETGWPSQGQIFGVAVPSKSEQKIAIDSIKAACGNSVFLFSAFDEYWKNSGHYGVEQFWGIF